MSDTHFKNRRSLLRAVFWHVPQIIRTKNGISDGCLATAHVAITILTWLNRSSRGGTHFGQHFGGYDWRMSDTHFKNRRSLLRAVFWTSHKSFGQRMEVVRMSSKDRCLAALSSLPVWSRRNPGKRAYNDSLCPQDRGFDFKWQPVCFWFLMQAHSDMGDDRISWHWKSCPLVDGSSYT